MGREGEREGGRGGGGGEGGREGGRERGEGGRGNRPICYLLSSSM